MRKVYMLPTLETSRQNTTNSIHQIVLHLAKHLPAFGYELTDNPAEADLIAGHAGQMGQDARVDVAHCHGLYPTAHHGVSKLWDAMNANVITSLRTAKQITVPSEWVADILRRDMGINPHVIGWGIEPDEWSAGENHGYVLWNKTRADAVCDPTPLVKLAEASPNVGFVTTFGKGTPNIKTTGIVPFAQMKEYIQHAAVYLATTKETFGIGTLEAMACGVPVLGFRHGSTTDIVQHGVTGYLIEPHDFDGLVEGLAYCLKYRTTLGANARKVALEYSFQRVAERFANVYDDALEPRKGVKVSVVIPCYNYGKWVADAMNSVYKQSANFDFEIVVVDDGSTDDPGSIVRQVADEHYLTATWLFSKENGGVASARNHGIERAMGEYIVCLDADDIIGSPHFLQTLADALDADPTLGIAYTGLTLMHEDGRLYEGVHSFPGSFNFDEQVAGRNQVPTCCMFRKQAWRRAGGYRKALEPAEDANLWLRMTSLGYGARQVSEEGMFHYRLHPNSLSSTIRAQKAREPKWNDFPWVKDGLRPFAAPPTKGRLANPVRNYDRPQVTFIIEVQDVSAADLERCLDSIEAQTFRFWECIIASREGYIPLCGHAWVKQHKFEDVIKRVNAPLVAVIEHPDKFAPDFLSKGLKHFQRTGEQYEEGGALLLRTSVWFNSHEPVEPFAVVHADTLSDMLRVEYKGVPNVVIGSATKQNYGYHREGDFLYVWTKDAQAMTEVLKPAIALMGIPKTPAPPKPKRLK